MNKQLSSTLDTISTIVISITVFLLPVFFLTSTTEALIFPKEVLIVASALILLVIWGVKIVLDKKVYFNANPLNLPIAIFAGVALVSSLLAVNRYEALFQTIPLLAAILFFFLIVNTVSEKRSFSFLLMAFLLGAAFSSVITVLYYFKIYFLPIPQIQTQFFNTLGSGLQQLIYLIPVFVFCLFYTAKRLGFPKIQLSNETSRDSSFFVQLVTGVIVLAGIAMVVYQMVATANKPILLPYIYGFQTAFASISQDATRFILSLLFGSGYGTFAVDFTRFRLPSFNLEPNIWNLTFTSSSSYFLELIATTGVLGGISFLFLIFNALKTRAKANPIFISLFVILIGALLLPFSFAAVALLFIIAAIYVSYLNIEGDKRVYDVSLSLVAKKNGMLSFEATPEDESRRKSESPVFPVAVFIIIVIIAGFVGLYTYKYLSSDIAFAESLRAAQANNGQKTYQLQTQAINTFPYRADYHRIFSQINFALANSVAQGIPKGSSPSAQVQQNISTLLQQSINSARNAVTLSPQTSSNWENLAGIYRNLIGVGQNSEQFTIASLNQAISLDPYNPQYYIELGGVYYQLKLWDQAVNQFQVAVNLKRDYANSYYNLGHALEQKGDLQNALQAYQVVAQLSAGNKQNLDQINKEIKAIQAKIGEQKANGGTSQVQPKTEQNTPLTVEQPQNALPTQTPQIKISPPPAVGVNPPTPATDSAR